MLGARKPVVRRSGAAAVHAAAIAANVPPIAEALAVEDDDAAQEQGEGSDQVTELPAQRPARSGRGRKTRSEPPPPPAMSGDSVGTARRVSRARHSRHLAHEVEELLEDAAEFEAQPLPGELPGDADEGARHDDGRLRSLHYALRREPEVDYSDQQA